MVQCQKYAMAVDGVDQSSFGGVLLSDLEVKATSASPSRPTGSVRTRVQQKFETTCSLKKVDDCSFVGWSEDKKTRKRRTALLLCSTVGIQIFVTDKFLSTVVTILVIDHVHSTVAPIANLSTP
jgi:hypothetical protein